MFRSTHILIAMTDTLQWKLVGMSSPDSHGVPLDSTLGPQRVNDFVPQQLLALHISARRILVASWRDCSNQPILDLQFMQLTQMAQPALSNTQKTKKILVPSVVARATNNKVYVNCLCMFLKEPSSSHYPPSGTAPSSQFPVNGPSSQKLPLILPHPLWLWDGEGG